jgi:hypothetical protein
MQRSFKEISLERWSRLTQHMEADFYTNQSRILEADPRLDRRLSGETGVVVYENDTHRGDYISVATADRVCSIFPDVRRVRVAYADPAPLGGHSALAVPDRSGDHFLWFREAPGALPPPLPRGSGVASMAIWCMGDILRITVLEDDWFTVGNMLGDYYYEQDKKYFICDGLVGLAECAARMR